MQLNLAIGSVRDCIGRWYCCVTVVQFQCMIIWPIGPQMRMRGTSSSSENHMRRARAWSVPPLHNPRPRPPSSSQGLQRRARVSFLGARRQIRRREAPLVEKARPNLPAPEEPPVEVPIRRDARGLL